NGMITVTTDMTDIGTGTYTILAQIAADAFNTSVDNVTVNLGDSQSPASCGSGGSFGAASTGSAVLKACEAVKSSLLSLLPEDYRDAQFLVTDKGLCVR
ncbi:MAG TPA: xanthine dehydrogenase family protein molybdopterin-binding subunit, partial [Alteromonas australica]|nr:xanthine dehydrogenase family protein molybdopterin-binding subunit [Alteromonas australica]